MPYERSYEVAPASTYGDPRSEIVLLMPYRYMRGGTVSMIMLSPKCMYRLQ